MTVTEILILVSMFMFWYTLWAVISVAIDVNLSETLKEAKIKINFRQFLNLVWVYMVVGGGRFISCGPIGNDPNKMEIFVCYETKDVYMIVIVSKNPLLYGKRIGLSLIPKPHSKEDYKIAGMKIMIPNSMFWVRGYYKLLKAIK